MKIIFLTFALMLSLVSVSSNAQATRSKLGDIYGGSLFTIVKSDDGVLYTGGSGLFKSIDKGNTWQKIEIKRPRNEELWINGIFIDGSDIFISGSEVEGDVSFGYILKSKDNGKTWNSTNKYINLDAILKSKSGDYYFGSGSSFYIYDKKNDSSRLLSSLPKFYGISSVLENLNGEFVVATDKGIFKSNDRGLSWDSVLIRNLHSAKLAMSRSGNIVEGSYGDKIYVSTDGGSTWKVNYPKELEVYKLLFDSLENLYAITPYKGLLKSDNYGTTWNSTSSEKLKFEDGIIDENNELLMCSLQYGVLHSNFKQNNKWIDKSSGINALTIRNVLINHEKRIFAGTENNGVYYSDDLGKSWINCFSSLNNYFDYISDIAINKKGFIFVSSNKSIYRSKDAGISWVKLFNNASVYEFKLAFDKFDNILAVQIDSREYFKSSMQKCIYRSTNDGSTWKVVYKTPDIQGKSMCISDDGTVAIMKYYYDSKNKTVIAGFLTSQDDCSDWLLDSTSKQYVTNYCNNLVVDKSGAYYLIFRDSLYKSENKCKNWSKLYIPKDFKPAKLKVDSFNSLFLIDILGKVIKSNDSGNSFEPVFDSEISPPIVDWFISERSTIIFACKHNLYISDKPISIERKKDSGYFENNEVYPNPTMDIIKLERSESFIIRFLFITAKLKSL